MMGQMGAMQLMMMGQMGANAMQRPAAGDAAAPGLGTGAYRSNPEETERQMGRQAFANAVAAMNRRDGPESDEDDFPSGPSSSVHHPNYRPADAEPIFGLTDRRFEGRLKLWFEEKGYGFIECPQIRRKFPDAEFAKVDVFLHQNQRRNFGKGDAITFGVFMNFRGKPQATELRRLREPTEDLPEC
mmetsp:Transcript_18102/g.56700  ORF Transcript_18102/g.56700 Transcript_18102/m.56700 type:complete len:186 (-) Transcript_18102:601-1158(-)